MWIPGHAQVGWFLARGLGLEQRDRRLVTVAAVLPDIDGLTLLGGLDSYLNGHHVYLHNLTTALAVPLLLATLGRRRITTAVACLGAFLLHLLSDGFGLLELRPLWPFSSLLWWPNQGDFAIAFLSEVMVPVVLLLWTAAVLRSERISFLETISPAVDRIIVDWLEAYGRQGQGRGRGRGARAVSLTQELIADLVLLAVMVGLGQVVLVTIGAPSWPRAAVIGTLATIVIRWLAPWLVLAWLRSYAAGFTDGDPGASPDEASTIGG